LGCTLVFHCEITGGWNDNTVDSTTHFPAVFSVDDVNVYKAP